MAAMAFVIWVPRDWVKTLYKRLQGLPKKGDSILLKMVIYLKQQPLTAVFFAFLYSSTVSVNSIGSPIRTVTRWCERSNILLESKCDQKSILTTFNTKPRLHVRFFEKLLRRQRTVKTARVVTHEHAKRQRKRSQKKVGRVEYFVTKSRTLSLV